jgi:hypothetical protein
MPVILSRDALSDWLSPDTDIAQLWLLLAAVRRVASADVAGEHRGQPRRQ